jgi:prolyl 4-hydroxylase
MKPVELQKHVYLIENFWTPEQCDDLIAKSESIGYGPATINTSFGARRVDHVRNNERVLYKDESFAASLWNELQPYAPSSVGDSKAIGLNELFRFYKYGPRQQFRRHRDESYVRNAREASYYTFMIYLNDTFTGGETTFDNLVVAPLKGSALIFLHQLLHAGSEVKSGTKYVLRTDIMYQTKK